MSLQPLTSQWSLATGSGGGFQMPASLVHATGTDNLQALVLFACEMFGNTIAMSQETLEKMERGVVPAPQPAALNFAPISVGYVPNDSFAYLGKSAAGLRFLGLAAALVTTVGASDGADAIQAAMESMASDQRDVPTYKTIYNVLNRFEPRCLPCGFADTMVNWQMLVSDAFRRHPLLECRQSVERWYHPSPGGIKSLILAFHQLSRIGSGDVTGVTVRTTFCAPWAGAFTKWCLGFAPSVMFDDKVPILKKDSKVSIIVPRRGTEHLFNVEIETFSAGPQSLVERRPFSQRDRTCVAMVSIKSFGQLLCQRYHMDGGPVRKLAKECLPHAIQLVLSNMTFTRAANLELSQKRWIPNYQSQNPSINASQQAQNSVNAGIHPLPSDKAIAKIMSLLLDTKKAKVGPPRSADGGISSLPLMQKHLQGLQKKCHCSSCSNRGRASPSSCTKAQFLLDFSLCVADILALSLFEQPEQLLVSNRFMTGADAYPESFGYAVYKTLTTGQQFASSIDSLLCWALQRVGHRIAESGPWVMSSYRGQAVWPTIYATQSISRRGFLALSWLPGLFLYNRDAYDECVFRAPNESYADPVAVKCNQQVVKPLNLCSGLRLQWRVGPLNYALAVSMVLLDGRSSPSSCFSNPSRTLAALAVAQVIDRCPHRPDKALKISDGSCCFASPSQPLRQPSYPGQQAPISIAGVNGSDELRFFSLSNCPRASAPLFLRSGACLECCLAACRRRYDARVGVVLVL